jgi:5-methylcytosine-specific restriction protein A
MPSRPRVHQPFPATAQRAVHGAAQRRSDPFYHTARWRRFSAWFLGLHPLCAVCDRDGRCEPATVTDHITPRRQLPQEQWLDESACQALCASCHARKTRSGQ